MYDFAKMVLVNACSLMLAIVIIAALCGLKRKKCSCGCGGACGEPTAGNNSTAAQSGGNQFDFSSTLFL